MKGRRSWVASLVLSWLSIQSAFGQGIFFTTTSQLNAGPSELSGRFSLTLNAEGPVYDALVFAQATGPRTLVDDAAYWEPGSERSFELRLASEHAIPGDYHLLVEVVFKDQGGANLSVSIGLPYRVAGDPDSVVSAQNWGEDHAPVSISPVGNRIGWQLPDSRVSGVRLDLTTGPSWTSVATLSPATEIIVLEEIGGEPALANWRYEQRARLSWVQNDHHFSQIHTWNLVTDADGKWAHHAVSKKSSGWPLAGWLGGFGLLLCCGMLIYRWRMRERLESERILLRMDEFIGGVGLLALTAWSLSHANLPLWWSHTWPTGGDMASQVYYAKVFMEWLPQGKISGWLPESFAGFPAFTFYFPLPFGMAALLQFVVGQQVALKLVSMSPVFLLPVATYALGGLWGWRVPLRLLGAAGATGFILTDATSIWGGNVLSQLAGEFAYSWGMIFAVLFWGVLSLALRRGGRWWLLAGVLEAMVALSHGYALLMAGFGAFVYLLVSAEFKKDLRVILQVHLLAFLLIGFWLIPLFENLPWTIPNDTPTALGSLRTAWPEALWPIALGWIPLLLILARSSAASTRGIFFLLGLALLGICGFNIGGHLGLADLRFYPYAQWAMAVASGAALGWALQRWLPAIALLLALLMTLAMTTWWAPHLNKLESWSHWNLSGYENKPMWPHYLATAQLNAGELHGPRLVFEHDPANADLGSTRTLEALPMFGSRPTLEGLYMESATSGPFIYQIQAEISQRPSSPLSRFPSTARSIDHAVGHLNEFFVERVVLRSREKRALFGADPRFELIATHGPLQTFRFKELRSQLVEPASTPLVARTRDDWLRHAFGRFVLDFPYRERTVYLGADQDLPEMPLGEAGGQVAIKEFSRERLVFETDRPGQPHLIRMTYHPRWASRNGEEIFLTEPSFMLIYPRAEVVELAFGQGIGGPIGIGFSVLGLLLLSSVVFSRAWIHPPASPGEPVAHRGKMVGSLAFASLAILVFWWNDPEYAYQRGHETGNQGDWVGAAVYFDRALAGRKNPSGQSEALFWAARGLDMGGEKTEAAVRYARLRREFPESYWYPESVFRLIEISLQENDPEAAALLFVELEQRVPDNPWTRKAADLMGDR